MILPSFGAAEQVRPGVHGTRSLHVVATEFIDSAGGTPRSVGIACLAPLSVHNEHLAATTHKDRSHLSPTAFAALANGQAVVFDKTHAHTASIALMKTFIGDAAPRRVLRNSSIGSRSSTPLLFAAMTRTATLTMRPMFGGVSTMTRTAAMLDDDVEVYIWNSGDTFYINDSELWSWIKEYFSWDGTFNVDDYVDCDHANNEWFTEQDELENFDADSVGYEAAVESVDNSVCRSQGNSQKTCIDMFIAAKTAGPFNGDNRNSDPDAGYEASRVQTYFDLDGLSGTMYFSSSTSWLPFVPTAPPDTAQSGAWIWATSDSTRTVQIKAYNGYCQYLPGAGSSDFVCPAIDAVVKFTKRSGQWIIANSANDVLRDPFPTMDVYNEDANHQFQPVFNSPETKWTDLYTKHSTLDTWRRKLNAGLPPGCYYQ